MIEYNKLEPFLRLQVCHPDYRDDNISGLIDHISKITGIETERIEIEYGIINKTEIMFTNHYIKYMLQNKLQKIQTIINNYQEQL